MPPFINEEKDNIPDIFNEDSDKAVSITPVVLSTDVDIALNFVNTKERVVVTEEDSRRIVRKTDLYVLSLLMWAYFLQALDKTLLGYSSVYGLAANAGLVGNQYSTIGSVGYYAQLGILPFAAYVLVKLRPKVLLPSIVTLWGAALCGMAGSHNFAGLVATRFLLGLFEAACLPLFSLITTSWYRRSEQPMRVAMWYSMNGTCTIFGSLLVYGLGHVTSAALYPYQLIFLVGGIVTVLTGPILYWRLDNSILEARFLSPEDRIKGVERLRSNNTGIMNTTFKKGQLFELLLDVKTYLFFAMSLLVNVGASTTSVFGPLILQGLVGFTPNTTTLLNIPFGCVQLLVIIAASYLAYRFQIKSYVFLAFMVPVIIGLGLLFGLEHVKSNEGPLLLGYYLLALVYAANPLIVAWIVANTAGATKKSAMLVVYNIASSCGNIIGPYLFKSQDAPAYTSGLLAVLIIFCLLLLTVVLQIIVLRQLNHSKENQREAQGKPRKYVDLSMAKMFDNSEELDRHLGDKAFSDLTDRENDEFLYVY